MKQKRVRLTQESKESTQIKKKITKKELTPRQLDAINFILAGHSLEEAAKKVSRSHATIHRWKKTETFKTRLKKERNVVFEQGLEVMKTAVDKAARTMIKLLDSRDPKERRLAAKEILNLSLKIAEYQGLEARIERLEGVVLCRTKTIM